MRHEFTHLSQNDPQWAYTPLGTSTLTLGQAGCYVTSYAVIATYFGHTINPKEMNGLLAANKLFAKTDLIATDQALQILYPDIVYTTSYYFPNTPPTPANLGQLRDLLANEQTVVIIEIDLGHGQVHFTPVIDCDGTRVTIMNVWNGREEDVQTVYGDPATTILRFIVYTGQLNDPLVCDKKSIRDMLVGKATKYDAFVTQGFPDASSVVSQLTALHSINHDLEQQVETLRAAQASSPVQGAPQDSPVSISPASQDKPRGFFATTVQDLFTLFIKRGEKA